ncbi:hypothetical protein ACFJIV_19705 [Mucilaginibacter sp. UC70_90]
MYEISATASGVEVYNDINDSQPVGHMNFPGIEDCDFALPVWGHSMYPYLENGCWVALKIIHDKRSCPARFITLSGEITACINACLQEIALMK